MRNLTGDEHDLRAFLHPDTLVGALVYLALLVVAATVQARLLRRRSAAILPV